MIVKEQILKQLQAYHEVCDSLMASLMATEVMLYPSQSPHWPTIVKGNKMINELKAQEEFVVEWIGEDGRKHRASTATATDALALVKLMKDIVQ